MADHCTDDQLILHHYGEGGREGRAIRKHLARCPGCCDRYQAMERVLAAVDQVPLLDPGAEYGAEVWRRLRPRLPARVSAGWREWMSLPRWTLAGAVTVLVLAAFLAGRFWRERVTPTAPAGDARVTASAVRERVLLVAVGEHLERTQMVLFELVNLEPGGAAKATSRGPEARMASGGHEAEARIDISAEQEWASELVRSNRLYRQTAARAREPAVESVLDELEPILLDIVHSPSAVSSRELERIRQRIEAQGILFKVRVIGSQVRERQKAVPPRSDRTTS